MTIRSLVIFLICIAGQVFSQKNCAFLNGQYLVHCDTAVSSSKENEQNDNIFLGAIEVERKRI